VLQKTWMAIGFILYLSIALVLPVVTRLLGVYSDQPSTWPRLAIPLAMIPFLMGFAQKLFGGMWRLMLGSPAIILLTLAIFSLVEDLVKKTDYLTQDLIFWPILIACYVGFSYLGKRTRDRLTVTSEAPKL
jgi:hypothetical protein